MGSAFNANGCIYPGLLREQETPLEIGKDWFLVQKIPAGGFVIILDSSQVWEERVDEMRTITTQGLTRYLDPGTVFGKSQILCALLY